MTTFDEFCDTFLVKPDERRKLAWQLGQMRARETYDLLGIDSATADLERRCFAPCLPGTHCECLGRVAE